jgi:hypothetical protein
MVCEISNRLKVAVLNGLEGTIWGVQQAETNPLVDENEMLKNRPFSVS